MTATLTVKNLDVSVSQSTPNFWQGADFLTSPDWTILDRVGDLGNGELQGYSPDQIFFDGTYLRIITEVKACHGKEYASGMMQFTPGFTFTYGSLEVRMRFAGGSGTWPAVWLLGAGCQDTNPTTADNGGSCNWPQISAESDEIDIMEFGGVTPRTSGNFQVHNNLGNDQRIGPIGFAADAGIHTYKLVRSPGFLGMYLDGSPTAWATITGSHVSDTPMGLLINVAVGGIHGGPVNNATLPTYSLIDYVHMVPA